MLLAQWNSNSADEIVRKTAVKVWNYTIIACNSIYMLHVIIV